MSNLQSFSWPRKSFNLPWPSPNPLSALLLLCPSSKTTYQRWQNINTEQLYIKFTSCPKKCLFTELPYLKLLRMENTLQYNTVHTFPGSWKVAERPGSHFISGEEKRRRLQLSRPRECGLQHPYINIFIRNTQDLGYWKLMLLVAKFETNVRWHDSAWGGPTWWPKLKVAPPQVKVSNLAITWATWLPILKLLLL